MERHYVPLRPAVPVARRGDPASRQVEKRRRVGVAVACNSCRRRKIRCDGQRPVCANCKGTTDQCEYRNQAPSANESHNLVAELVRTLADLPATEAVQVLRQLRADDDTTTIISALRETRTLRSSEHGRLSFTELEPQNPIAYPSLPPFDPAWLQRGHFRALTEPTTRDRTSSSDSSSEQPSISTPVAAEESHGPLYGSPFWSRRETGFRDGVGARKLCDTRLQKLNIGHWTKVDMDNGLAANCISLYLETDHPLLGHFDPDLFVSNLTSERNDHCSPLLVNALLYWACQMYSAIDPQADKLATRFSDEAEALWSTEFSTGRDSVLNLAAAVFLSLGYLGQGRDHRVLKYLAEACSMGTRMGLFGVQSQVGQDTEEGNMQAAAGASTSRLHAAWGVFNWIK